MNDAPRVRRQLTLFVPPPEGPALDALRARLDPVQAGLIAAHVTLCREDELQALGWPQLQERLDCWPFGALALVFGPAERFQGHGLLRPCTAGADGFQALRRWVLRNESVRVHPAHLTLAHPRNPVAAGNDEPAFAACAKAPPLRLTLATATLIEQAGASAWRRLHQRALGLGVAADPSGKT